MNHERTQAPSLRRKYPLRGEAARTQALEQDAVGQRGIWQLSSAQRHQITHAQGPPCRPAAARIVDRDIKGIHCLLKADVDKDGKLDVIINNFEPEGVLADSIAWFRAPKDLKKAERWERFVFADRDARGGSHYFGFGDVNGDGLADVIVSSENADVTTAGDNIGRAFVVYGKTSGAAVNLSAVATSEGFSINAAI